MPQFTPLAVAEMHETHHLLSYLSQQQLPQMEAALRRIMAIEEKGNGNGHGNRESQTQAQARTQQRQLDEAVAFLEELSDAVAAQEALVRVLLEQSSSMLGLQPPRQVLAPAPAPASFIQQQQNEREHEQHREQHRQQHEEQHGGNQNEQRPSQFDEVEIYVTRPPWDGDVLSRHERAHEETDSTTEEEHSSYYTASENTASPSSRHRRQIRRKTSSSVDNDKVENEIIHNRPAAAAAPRRDVDADADTDSSSSRDQRARSRSETLSNADAEEEGRRSRGRFRRVGMAEMPA